jgi:Uncharacterised protein family (UPF0259)
MADGGGGDLGRDAPATREDQGQPAPGEGRGQSGARLLRPGQILAATARAGRRAWWRILAVSVAVSMVSAGLEIVTDHYVDPSDAVLSSGATLSTTAISLLGTVLVSGFVCRLVGAAVHGREQATLRQVVRSLPWLRLVAADLLVTVIVIIGLVLLLLPGLAALTFLAVVGPVIEIEHRKVRDALRRSAQLVRGHFWLVALLATLPIAVASELEVAAPDPDHLGQIAQFLVIRGLAEGAVEACIALVLAELCFRLIDAARESRRPGVDSAGHRG